MMKALPVMLLLGMILPLPADLVERTVAYRDGDQVFEGYHVYDDLMSEIRPGVLVVHQWTGLSDYEKRRARELAQLGYNVFALDIYGKGVRPPAPGAAAAESGKYKKDRALFRQRLKLGLEVLLKDPQTDPGRVAAVGYCFGGAGVLEMARAGMPVQAVVSYHGSLNAADGMAASKAMRLPKVLVLHGAADPYAPMLEVASLQEELEKAGADYQLLLFGSQVVHSFTQPHAGNDPSKGAAYDAVADRRSWQAMTLFLQEVFGEL